MHLKKIQIQVFNSMAAELEERCPICLDSCKEPSFVMTCLHRFCYPCILRWAQSKPECPLCKRRVLSIVAKSCTWGGTTPGTGTCGELPHWSAALER
uniref:RING-type E3 ubiquitin transferase n=1 Tax=Falco tinnunculus TaxID=100819 RepID=A0A8C4TW87_FALTI